MKVWLVDFDGKMENLALMRLSTWHKHQGDDVILKVISKGRRLSGLESVYPQFFDLPDKVYISCLFRWNADMAHILKNQWDGRAELGGTGVDIAKTLPIDVATSEPDYSLYGFNRAVGFISRGCINRCPWCVVWRKEGKLNRVSSAESVVGNYPEAIFLDNNFLALSGHEDDLSWVAATGTRIDFNQGLDAKYVTPSNAKLMAQCNWLAGPRLALDADARQDVVERALAYLQEAGMSINRIMLFVLIGFHGLESDVRRLLKAREWGIQVYPMGYRNLETGEEPAYGWNRQLYNKYRRLMIRIPHAHGMWEDFEHEVAQPGGFTQ